MSGAQIVFGIARRVPLSEYSKIVFGQNEHVRICNISTTHTTAESIIFHESNLLTTFRSVTSRRHPVIISNRLLACRSIFRDAVSLARLVKAEIVSPYCGILIDTGVGNPTVPLA